MANHVLALIFGFLGGAIPGSIHLAWTIRRNNQVTSGNIDLTYRKKK